MTDNEWGDFLKGLTPQRLAEVHQLLQGIVSSAEALHKAALHGDVDLVRRLLAAGVNPNGLRHKSPLLAATKNGHFTVVRELLRAGADTEASDDRGNTSVHIAAFQGSTSILEALLNDGANPNAKNNLGATPLAAASNNNHEAAALKLREAGAAG